MGACVCARTDAYSSPPMCGHTHCYNTLTTLWSRQSPIGHLLFVLFVYFRAHFLSRYIRVAKRVCEFSCVPEYKYTAKHTKTLKYIFTFVRATVEREYTSLKRTCVSVLPCNCRSKLPVRDKFPYLNGNERKIILRLVG